MAGNLVITNIQALDTFCTLNLGVLRTNKATISSDLRSERTPARRNARTQQQQLQWLDWFKPALTVDTYSTTFRQTFLSTFIIKEAIYILWLQGPMTRRSSSTRPLRLAPKIREKVLAVVRRPFRLIRIWLWAMRITLLWRPMFQALPTIRRRLPFRPVWPLKGKGREVVPKVVKIGLHHLPLIA